MHTLTCNCCWEEICIKHWRGVDEILHYCTIESVGMHTSVVFIPMAAIEGQSAAIGNANANCNRVECAFH
jgi:hypothetical protein